MRPHIAVLDPGTRVPELDAFNRMSRRSRLPLTYHLPAMQGLDSLRRVEDATVGVVVFGSGASVHDDLPWQDELRDWLAPQLQRLPVLGLCYGHQLLAQMLGGEVDFLFEDRHKLKGLREVTLQATPLWGAQRRGPLVVSHREAVTRIPDGCELLGATDDCAIEAFRHRSLPLWGIQAHPEATSAFVANNDVGVDAPDEVYAFGHALVDAFLDHVASSTSEDARR